jgi:hypothetical protein
MLSYLYCSALSTLDLLHFTLHCSSHIQEEAGSLLAELRLMQLPPTVLPYKIPEEYAALPRLMGRVRKEQKRSSLSYIRIICLKIVLNLMNCINLYAIRLK